MYYTSSMTQKPRITMTLDQRLVDAIDAAAEREGMNRSTYVNWVLYKLLLVDAPPAAKGGKSHAKKD